MYLFQEKKILLCVMTNFLISLASESWESGTLMVARWGGVYTDCGRWLTGFPLDECLRKMSQWGREPCLLVHPTDVELTTTMAWYK